MNYDTSKIDEWDLDMCVDYLMQDWEWRDASPDNKVSYGWRGCWHHKTKAFTSPHAPISRTLDEAAKLPEGWVLRSYVTYLCHCEAIAEYFPKFDEAPSMQITASTSTKTDERLVRFRLRCKVESLTVRAEGEVTK